MFRAWWGMMVLMLPLAPLMTEASVLGLPVLTLLGLVLAAFVAGWVDSVVGGGGLIQLPSLVIGLPDDTPTPTVLGTNKLSSVAGTLVASVTYVRKVRVEAWTVIPLVLAAFAGSAFGSLLARFIPKSWLTPIVLVALIAVGAYTFLKPQMGLEHRPSHRGIHALGRVVGIGLLVGFYDGILGPGTGSFFVIGMVAVLGYGFLEATVNAKIANLTTNVASILVFGAHGELLVAVGLVMAMANLTGGALGARMALQRGSAFIRRIFLVVLGILVVKLAWDTASMWF